MTFQPGHTLSPGRRLGSRNKRTAEVFNRLESRGDLDPADLLSSIVTNPQEQQELRIQAAGLLMPYKYSKCGTAPVLVYVDIPLECPEFTHLSDAEQFLAKVAALVASGQLDFQAGQNLSTLAKNWIDAQYAKEELAIKQMTAGATDHEQRIVISGGLSQLPGTETILPQVIDGRIVQPIMIGGQLVHPETKQPITNGHALAAPADAVPAIEAAPKAQDPEPPPQDPEL